MVDRAHAAWKNGNLTDVLFMDMKTAFPSMARGWLANLKMVR